MLSSWGSVSGGEVTGNAFWGEEVPVGGGEVSGGLPSGGGGEGIEENSGAL